MISFEQKKEVEEAIARGQTAEAIELIKSYATEHSILAKISVSLDARLAIVKRNVILGLITSEQHLVEANKINNAVLEVVRVKNVHELEKIYRGLVSSIKGESSSRSAFLIWGGVFFSLGLVWYLADLFSDGTLGGGWFFLGFSAVLNIFSLLRQEDYRKLSRVTLIAACLLIMLAYIANVVINWIKKPEDIPPQPKEELVQPKEAEKPIEVVEKIDSIALLSKMLKIVSSVDDSGEISGTVINNSNCEIGSLEISAHLLNSNGKSMQANWNYVNGSDVPIKPGDSRPFNVFMSGGFKKGKDFTSYSCEVRDFYFSDCK